MGEIKILRDVYSTVEQVTRTIRIFTPNAYQQQPDKAFPVLYMFDGQNVFSHPESAVYDTWCANTTIEQYSFGGVYLDYVPVTRDFYHHIKQLGYSDYEVHFNLAQGQTHHETSWQRQLPGIMRWLLE
ncbi:alpha/beta hydrolase-fold protein [Iningainema tapete]|uniref:Esterase n=1 Tax=Iningainema tapete BLCC-T55 TaxID=2748662 RepID=A0A8J6XEK9_9CYAN|nr:alpha/beta hydrolase-fold protein [Iningainema tapete]MBD2774129.1 hypothetical protein [Iningainema tapete BLCC-T55]